MAETAAERAAAHAQTREDDAASSLMRSISELFVAAREHTAQDLALFEDLALGLYGTAPAADRAYAARLLAGCADLPKPIARLIVNDDIHIAGPFVATSQALDAADLMAILGRFDRDLAMAVAERPSLPATVARALGALSITPAPASEPAAPEPVTIDVAPMPTLPAIRARDEIVEEVAREPVVASEASEPAPVPVQNTPAAEARPRGDLASFLALDSDARHRYMLSVEREVAVGGREPRRSNDGAAVGDRLFAAMAGSGRKALADALVLELALDQRTAAAIIDDRAGEPLTLALAALEVPEKQATSLFILAFGLSASLWQIRSLISLLIGVDRRAAAQIIAGWRNRPAPEPRRAADTPPRDRSLDDAIARVSLHMDGARVFGTKRA